MNADNLSKGRRSTMNSRDAAYEEEQLRRAIEESKREGGTLSIISGMRKSKRSRSESEECVSQPVAMYLLQNPKLTDNICFVKA